MDSSELIIVYIFVCIFISVIYILSILEDTLGTLGNILVWLYNAKTGYITVFIKLTIMSIIVSTPVQYNLQNICSLTFNELP